jgi:CubicO group peptidase (beta-lactamase class C family)
MKKLFMLVVAVFLLLQSGNAVAQNFSELDEFIVEQMELNQVPGLSAVIILDDSVYWNNNYGYMNLEDSIAVNDSTLFSVFSISKSVTSATIMQLVDKGYLSLDQNINDFIPFYIMNPRNGSDSISPRMLMSHSACVKNWNFNDFITIGDPTESLSSFIENYYTEGGDYFSQLNFYSYPPGTYYSYDNIGIALLGYLAEPLTGMEFIEYALDSILYPLNMTNSSWRLSDLNLDNLATGYSYSAGNYIPYDNMGHPAYPGVSLRSSALEIANFNNMLLNNGVFEGRDLLSATAIDSMTRVQDSLWMGSYGPSGLGIYCAQNFGDRVAWGHNGGSMMGFAAQYYFCKDENSGIVITTNSEKYLPLLVEYLFDFALAVQSGVDDQEHESEQIRLYPNPVSERLYFASDINTEVFDIMVYNLGGQVVRMQQQAGNSIQLSGLPAGMYILEARTEKGIVRRKFIKR